MIVGAIDVGSNSVKLLVASKANGKVCTLAHRLAITRIGAGVSRGGKITLEAADRTLEVLSEYRALCDHLNCDRVVAVGTEALRVAKNAKDFVERCEFEADVRLKIISGTEEARLAFLGATADWPGRTLASVEIGGGSTQVTIGRDGKATWRSSSPIGAVNLTQKELRSDPPTLQERSAALRAATRVLPKAPKGAGEVVGIGGTAATLAAILAARRDTTRIHGLRAVRDEVKALYQELVGMRLARRRLVPGLDPDRADILPAGLLILDVVLETLGARTVRISRHGLRRGVVLEALSRGR